MRLAGALAMMVLSASAAHAGADFCSQFVASHIGFWRPAAGGPPDVLLYISDHSSILSTPCFASHAAVGDGETGPTDEHPSVIAPGAACAATRPAFDDLRRALGGITASHPSAKGVVLQGADGKDVLTLISIPPDGIEYRRFTVTAYRHGKTLETLRHFPDFTPDFVLYSGRFDGDAGCGLVDGSYKKLGPSRYEFDAGPLLMGFCENNGLLRAEGLFKHFNGIRDVKARGKDFLLRDQQGRVQIILSPISIGEKP